MYMVRRNRTLEDFCDWWKILFESLLSCFNGWHWRLALSIWGALWALPAIVGQFSNAAKMMNISNIPSIVSFNALHIVQYYGLWAIGILLVWGILDQIIQLRKQIRDGRYELAKLRSEGVTLRNDGTRTLTTSQTQYVEIKDNISLNEWGNLIVDWNNRVIKALQKVSEADAEWFKTMDVIHAPRVSYSALNDDHQHLLSLHDTRLDRLGQMIYQSWKEN